MYDPKKNALDTSWKQRRCAAWSWVSSPGGEGGWLRTCCAGAFLPCLTMARRWRLMLARDQTIHLPSHLGMRARRNFGIEAPN